MTVALANVALFTIISVGFFHRFSPAVLNPLNITHAILGLEIDWQLGATFLRAGWYWLAYGFMFTSVSGGGEILVGGLTKPLWWYGYWGVNFKVGLDIQKATNIFSSSWYTGFAFDVRRSSDYSGDFYCLAPSFSKGLLGDRLSSLLSSKGISPQVCAANPRNTIGQPFEAGAHSVTVSPTKDYFLRVGWALYYFLGPTMSPSGILQGLGQELGFDFDAGGIELLIEVLRRLQGLGKTPPY